MPALTKPEILSRLAAHRPIDSGTATQKVTVRWLATGALVFLLPLGVFLLRNQHPFLADHAWGLAFSLTAVGLLGVFIGYRAVTRRLAAERRWGFAALTKEECLELGEISSDIPEITAIVDHWLEVWVSSGNMPRGRDLALVREMVSAWNTAGAGVVPHQVHAQRRQSPI